MNHQANKWNGKCRNCGEGIIFIRSVRTGNMIPCTPKRYSIISEAGRIEKGYEHHAATCKRRLPHLTTKRKAKE